MYSNLSVFYISITLLQINRKDVDNFSQSWSLNPPNIPVQVSANSRMNDFRNNLKYPITVEGIEVTDNQVLAEDRPKIVITRSLDSNLLSECLYNTYL